MAKAPPGPLSETAAQPVGMMEMIDSEIAERRAIKYAECNNDEMLHAVNGRGRLLNALLQQTTNLRKITTASMPKISADMAVRLKSAFEAADAKKAEDVTLDTLEASVTHIHETVTQTSSDDDFQEQLSALKRDAALAEESE